jgi:hypothetical protein
MSKRIIHLRNYEYGRIYPRLRKAVDWIHSHRRLIKATCKWGFDFDDYWGMPKKISSKLSSDEVDFIQAETYEWAEKYFGIVA